MKKVLITVLAMFAIATMSAQNYNADYKYSLFSNLEIGLSGQFSRGLNNPHYTNFGGDFRITKRIGDYWRLRAIADVNGFKKDGKFDRYGKGMIGISFDLLPFYIYGDYGLNINPSFKDNKFGIAADAGAGLQFKLGNTLRLHTEVGVDRVNNGSYWKSNLEAKVGFTTNLGVTEEDRRGEQLQRTLPTRCGELTSQNRELESQLNKSENTNKELQSTLERVTNVVSELEKRLNICENNKKEECPEFEPIYFDYASSEINSIEVEKLIKIADKINESPLNILYKLEGWCSNNGDPNKNQRLAEERVRNVYWLLVAYGVDEDRLLQLPQGQSNKDEYLEQKVVITKQ